MSNTKTISDIRFEISSMFRAIETKIDSLQLELITVAKERDELLAKVAEKPKKEEK